MDLLLAELEQRCLALEVELVLRRVDAELRVNDGPRSYEVAKLAIAEVLHTPQDFTLALRRVRDMRGQLHSWEQTGALLFTSIRSGVGCAAGAAGWGDLLLPLVSEVVQAVHSTYHVEEARFAKKLLECSMSSSSMDGNSVVVGVDLAKWLIELKNPHIHIPLRCIGVDVLAMFCVPCYLPVDEVVRLVKHALLCATSTSTSSFLNKGMEDSVRRLCESLFTSSSSSSASYANAVGCVLVETLWATRGVVSAYKLSQKFGLARFFPELTEIARREQIVQQIALGPNKAFGWATIKPDRRLQVMALLMERGHHLTAQRLLQSPNEDLARIQKQYGQRLDLQACEQQLAARRATYMQLSECGPVVVHFIDSMLGLRAVERDLVFGEGVLTLDAEWDARVSAYGTSVVQLVQFARGKHHVFLIDVSPRGALLGGSSRASADEFHAYMQDVLLPAQQHEGVWGFGLEMDCNMLQKSFPREQWPKMLAPLARNIPTPNRNTGLSSLCELVLGRPLDKEQQMSVWSRRPLLPEQIEYAALDAHVLALLHDRLEECRAAKPAAVVVAAPVAAVAPPPAPPPPAAAAPLRFCCDEMLLRMAKMLRAVNVDCSFESSGDQVKRRDALTPRLERARLEGRIFITADLALRQHGAGVYVLTAKDNETRFKEVCQHFSLPLDPSAILLRCTMCNGPEFTIVTKTEARELNPTVVTDVVFQDARITEYFACPQCRSVVWQGPKYKQVQSRMSRLMDDTAAVVDKQQQH